MRWFGWHQTIDPGVGDPGREVYYFFGIPLVHRCIIYFECNDPHGSLFGQITTKSRK